MKNGFRNSSLDLGTSLNSPPEYMCLLCNVTPVEITTSNLNKNSLYGIWYCSRACAVLALLADPTLGYIFDKALDFHADKTL
jgi:hypothetical protein